ncbi:MAG: DinB family protein [Ilumatobacteraceae bacterium]|jgi:uncharacterized damage-inducible protein DinB
MSEEPRIDEHGRPEPPTNGSEGETLVGFLEYQRATFMWRTHGLTATDLRRSVAASSMTLGGMIKHLALVEDYWFSRVLLDAADAEPWASVDWSRDRDWDWNSAADDSPESLVTLWSSTVERSRSAVDTALAAGDLSTRAMRAFDDGTAPSLRWILCHMVEEYARHNGHADLIREAIDGSVGE